MSCRSWQHEVHSSHVHRGSDGYLQVFSWMSFSWIPFLMQTTSHHTITVHQPIHELHSRQPLIWVHRVNSSQSPRMRLIQEIHNMLISYGKGLLTLCPTPKLRYHPLPLVCGCLFIVFAAVHHNWWLSLYPGPANLPHKYWIIYDNEKILWELCLVNRDVTGISCNWKEQ
jgi:hypothetical protein